MVNCGSSTIIRIYCINFKIKDEDEQIAIALAASMKQVKRKRIEQVETPNSEPEFNSDFESIDGDSDLESNENDSGKSYMILDKCILI